MLDNELWLNWISFSVASLSEIQQGVRAASCAFSPGVPRKEAFALITCVLLCREPVLGSESYCGDCRLEQLKIIVNLEIVQLCFAWCFPML